jgi:hypothetical protein
MSKEDFPEIRQVAEQHRIRLEKILASMSISDIRELLSNRKEHSTLHTFIVVAILKPTTATGVWASFRLLRSHALAVQYPASGLFTSQRLG